MSPQANDFSGLHIVIRSIPCLSDFPRVYRQMRGWLGNRISHRDSASGPAAVKDSELLRDINVPYLASRSTIVIGEE